MIKIETLTGKEMRRLPAVIVNAVSRFDDLHEIEVWKTEAPRDGLYEYRAFKQNSSLPCVRICLSDEN